MLSLKQNQLQTFVKEEGCPKVCDESLMFLQNGASTFDSAVFFRSIFSQGRAGCRLLDRPANNKSTHIKSFIYLHIDIQDKPYIYTYVYLFRFRDSRCHTLGFESYASCHVITNGSLEDSQKQVAVVRGHFDSTSPAHAPGYH